MPPGVRGLCAALGGLAQGPGRLHRMPLSLLLKRDHMERNLGTSALLRGPQSLQPHVGPGEGPGPQPETAPAWAGCCVGRWLSSQGAGWVHCWAGFQWVKGHSGPQALCALCPLTSGAGRNSSPSPGPCGSLTPGPGWDVFRGLGHRKALGEGPRTKTGPRWGERCYHDSMPAPRRAVPARH